MKTQQVCVTAADRLEAFRKLSDEISEVVKDVRERSSEGIAQRFFNVLVNNQLPDGEERRSQTPTLRRKLLGAPPSWLRMMAHSTSK